MEILVENLNEARKDVQACFQSQKKELNSFFNKSDEKPKQMRELFDAFMELNDKNSG